MKTILNICISLFSSFTLAICQVRGTAAEFFIKADSIASSRLAEPTLLEILADTVDMDGKNDKWVFKFDSLMLTINGDTVISDTSCHQWTGMAPVEGHWMDSDSALIIAEEHGGREFRQNHGSSTISVWLLHASGCPWSEWMIDYQSNQNPQVGFGIFFDALDGSNIYTYYSDVKMESEIPDFELYQNYPNPFNAETKIAFTLPAVSEVTLNIYSIDGRSVYRSERIFNQGYNEIVWNPEGLSTGIYLYKIIYGPRSYQSSMLYLK
jgi:hypothetical protein